MRHNNRPHDALREVHLTPSYSRHAEGSCLVEFGHTKVLCTASVQENIPPFLRGTGKGWVTAEYGMLPRATNSRNQREAAKGSQSGRTQEIQRLIGRSLRSVCKLPALGERQILIDCDVIEADGGTRTASITGAYVALHQACQKLMDSGVLAFFPLTQQVAAISCGIHKDVALLDLDYPEDSSAEADANFVIASDGNLVEIQGTAETKPFSEDQFLNLLRLAKKGTHELFELQRKALNI